MANGLAVDVDDLFLPPGPSGTDPGQETAVGGTYPF